MSMKRREFVSLLGGAVAWPLAARAQERVRRIGVLMSLTEGDPETKRRIGAFLEGLRQLGWADGGNAQINYRWGGGNPNDIRRYAAELAALAPDVILATGSVTVGPLLEVTRTVPIVFVQVPDPVAAGFVESLARPGGNATGFVNFEYGMGAKWLELLKQIAPTVTRVGVLRDPALAVGAGQYGAIQSVAPSLAMEASPINLRDAGEIDRGIANFARVPNGGLILTGGALGIVHRDLIVTLAARHNLPAVYIDRYFAEGGGLISYGPDSIDAYRRTAAYVDRILKGDKPASLPVQLPVKYDLVINLKTAKALGVTVPPSLVARADEVIE
jgi:putative ABC transport system substrate-binding protein